MTMSSAIVVSDIEGRIELWNRGAEELFGYSAAEAIGQSLDLIIPERYRERHWAGFNAAMKTGNSVRSGAANPGLPALGKDGAERRFPARFLFLKDALEKPAGAMAIFSRAGG